MVAPIYFGHLEWQVPIFVKKKSLAPFKVLFHRNNQPAIHVFRLPTYHHTRRKKKMIGSRASSTYGIVMQLLAVIVKKCRLTSK